MDAGRDLDAFVARAIFGCTTIFEEGWHCGCKNQPHDFFNDDGRFYWLKEYSTNIKDAWEVVEKIKTRETYIEILSHKGDPHWICRIYKDGPYPVAGAGAGTAALAICLAALEAVKNG